jgi:hypothetical protein
MPIMPEIDYAQELLEFVRWMEQQQGRPLTPAEIKLSIAQAQALGELSDPPLH